MIAGAAIPVLPRGVRVHHCDVRKMWVLLAPERAMMLDDIGHAILSRVDGTASFANITKDLSETFDAPLDAVSADSAEFLSALLERHFLEIRP